MSLRPRYSLLTLLLLTAAVAVGIKLWRGPHRVVMSAPPTVSEQAILDRAYLTAVHAAYFKPEVYEYDFVRTWQGLDCATVKGRSGSASPVFVIPTGDTMRFLLSTTGMVNGLTVQNLAESTQERLVCWIHSGQLLPPARTNPVLSSATGQIIMGKHYTYYLSNQKRLYVDAPTTWHEFSIRLIQMTDVTDPILRARIAEELASTPGDR